MSRFVTKLGLVLALALHVSVLGGDKQGNGGDHVRSVFLRVGGAALKFVETTPAGKNLQVEGSRLRAVLSIKHIKVEEKALYDAKGMPTASLVVPGMITLYGPSWLQSFEKQEDVYFEALHLLLLSAGYSDDNHTLSRALHPFPNALRVPTRGVDGPEDSSEMPYADRRRHLLERCDEIAERVQADQGKLRAVLELQEALLTQTPSTVATEEDATRYRTLFNGYETRLNELSR